MFLISCGFLKVFTKHFSLIEIFRIIQKTLFLEFSNCKIPQIFPGVLPPTIFPQYAYYQYLKYISWLRTSRIYEEINIAKVIHSSKKLFCYVGQICNLVQEFNGLVSKRVDRKISPFYFIKITSFYNLFFFSSAIVARQFYTCFNLI